MIDGHVALPLGVFVGGGSTRMGGHPKGLLPAPDTGEPLVARLLRVGREAGLAPVLVGDASAYLDVCGGVESLADQPAGVGPMGGLGALLQHARTQAAPHCLAVACDMPFVTVELLSLLRDTAPEAAALAPRDAQSGRWQPMCARFAPEPTLRAVQGCLADGKHSLQQVFRRLPAIELQLDAAHGAQLRDWDRPEDIGPLA